MGFLTIAASTGAIIVGSSSSVLQTLLWLSIPVCVIQVLSAFPLHNLKVRHYSNFAMTILAFVISVTIAQVSIGDVTGIGGYAGIGCACFYSAFKTRMIISAND